jgi:Na+/H+-dicarboxylate symporter/ABC-type amino acid transport substrate-binding protein
MNEPAKKKKGISLSTQILIGLGLGVFTGLFFGEAAGSLAIYGRAYVGLIQMSILPYMVVSLIAGIGHLSAAKARNLAVTGGLVLLASWVLAFAMVFILPLSFPAMEAGSFYSPSLVQPAQVNFIDLYIPSNPFSSLARTVVPAAAVFSVVLGIALIGLDDKKPLLEVLSVISKGLSRMAMLVVKLTPFGVFAIAANAAGTMTIEELGRLQTYIITFVIATLVLTFWILPALVATVTPFKYRDIFTACRAALVTGFVTGNLFIVLPMLVESAKELFEKYGSRDPDTDSYIEVLVPTSFNFPNIGKLLTLLFVLFAGWYTGKSITVTDYPTFSMLGLFTLFGGVDLALPFLLDQLRIPSDMYQLYVVTGVVNGWFATLLAVMNLFAFTLAATCAATGTLKLNWLRLGQLAVISLLLLGASIVGTRLFLANLLGDEDVPRRTLMQQSIKEKVPALVYTDPAEVGPSVVRESRLAAVLDRGTLRVGYNPDNLPFSFFNDNDELVGYDVELMHLMAREIGVGIEFVPWSYSDDESRTQQADIFIGGLLINVQRLTRYNFTLPYIEATLAMVVEDHLRNDFKSWRQMDEDQILRLGITGDSRATELKRLMPNTDIVVLDNYQDFFRDNPNGLDAIVITAEAGSAWTILYPDYAVALPEPFQKAPMALAVRREDTDLRDLLNEWMRLKKTDGTLDRLYDKWVLGKSDEDKKPRWSIARDVLGWDI